MARPFALTLALVAVVAGCRPQSSTTPDSTAGQGLIVAPDPIDRCLNADSAAGWCTLEADTFEWRRGAPPYQLVLERATDPSVAETMGTRLRIRRADGLERSFFDTLGPGGLTPDEWKNRPASLTHDNLLNSEYLLATSRLRTPTGDPTIMVAGWGYASDQPTFRVIGLTPDGTPELVLYLEHFGLVEIQDVDRDGRAELLGYQWMSEGFGRCYWEYNPVFVVSFSATNPFRGHLDETLSAEHNRREGRGWAGPAHNDEMVYVTCAPGGERLMRKSDADTLTIPGH